MFKINLKNGFTLLEALVAISILMVAVVAPITIAQKGLTSAYYSKNQMIASYLAQDAIEYVKNVRDYASINSLDGGNHNFDWGDALVGGSSWLHLCLTPNNVGNGCQIDTIKNAINDNTAILAYSDTSKLQIDNTNKFYGYTSGTSTDFTRQIKINVNPTSLNIDEALITVTVKWGTDSIEVKTLLYNI